MNYRDNATPCGIVSGSVMAETVTLADSKGQGADQPCREAVVWCEAAKVVSIGGSEANAIVGGVLPGGTTPNPITIPVSNTNKLFFAGTTGDKVYILWRS